MRSGKTMTHNIYLLEQFFRVSILKPNRGLNDKLVRELIELAVIVA